MPMIALLVVFVVMLPTLVHADLNEDFAACRRTILQIGSNPRSPAEQYCLGLSHAFALNHKKDRAEAAEWFRKAADQNHAAAAAVLGYLYERGDGVRADPAEAARWYRTSADQNNSDGLFNLGRAYEHGIGLSKDIGQARTYYQKAAAAGSRDARQALAGLGKGPVPITAAQEKFDEGVRLYKAKNFAGAAKVFQQLADRGDSKAQLQIGYQYQYGEGVRQSSDEAVRWYRKSADQGNAVAQANLGKMYEDAIGVREDWAEAVRWYRKSAEQGYAEGQFSLGRAYQFGIAVPQSRQDAIRWFDMAGDQGHDQANYFANDLKQRNRYVGFRNEQEHATVVGNKLRGVLLNIEPAGRTFRNSAERMAYLRQAGKQADSEEEMLRRESKTREYKACVDSGASGCIPP
ncbi:MAG: SEL1-like repeat protein [Nitrospira sp.]|jgi:TPR repeat protein|nr:SEL1-like repeat protein [Nitrospira sp.]